MEFLDRNVKKMPSLSYAEYFEGIQSYECEDCETIIYSDRGYCSECRKPNLKHLPLFCCKCRRPIQHKEDYLLNNNEVSELPQVYLLCNCSKGLWLPLVKDIMPFHNQRDNQRLLTSDDLKNRYVHHVCDLNRLNPSEDVKNHVYFTKCQKKEEDLFLQSYIKANIALDQSMEDELESLSKDYYKLCSDTIALNLKLGLLNVFLNHRFGHHWISVRLRLENSINDLLQYSSPTFWADYMSTYFDSCIVRIYRLMDNKYSEEHTNSYHTYRERYLKHYPEQKSKWGIGKIDKRLATLRNRYVAHNDTRFNPEVLQKGLAVLYDFYIKKVLKSINILNEMQGLKIVFAYDPGELLLHRSIARPILKIIDKELERDKEAGEYPRSEIV